MNPPRVLFLGRATFDLLYRLDQLPQEDTKVFARQFHAAPGGPALNAALTHALLGGKALLISAVGGGPWADGLRGELARHGVDLLDLAAGTAYETPPVTVLINAANGSRTAVNPPQSLAKLRSLGGSWAEEMPAAWSQMPPVILCDGFHLGETLPFLEACRAAAPVAICLDGGSWKPGTAALAPLLTAAICSERFTVPGQAEASPEATFAWFAARGVPCVAVTRGSKPILAWERGRCFQIEIASVAATDTLGAGDVLHGAFCHFFARSPEFEPALRQAAAIATRSCQGLGIQAWAAQSNPGAEQTSPAQL
jgi:sugar/nucleoside kinase (ribokinase family)